MSIPAPFVSVVIVNYRSVAFIETCLKSLFIFNANNIEVVVVDNSAEGADLHKVLAKIDSRINIMDAGYNAGFARANNLGIKASSREMVLLLNPDTIIENDAVNGCAKSLAESEYVAAGVQLLHADGSAQFSGSRNLRGGLNVLLPVPVIGKMLRLIALSTGTKRPAAEKVGDVQEVDWINGAFLMVKRSAILQAGLLDEDFFLYAEETEWCARLRKAGKLCLFGQYRVTHHEGKSANQTFNSVQQGYQNMYDRKGGQIMLSNLLRIRKEFGAAWFLFHLFIYTVGIPFAFIVSFRNAAGYARNVWRVITLSAKIISGRPHFYKAL